MKTIYFLALIVLLALSCAHLPAIQPPAQGTASLDIDRHCEAIYPTGNWQLLHVIEASPPAMPPQTLMGLSQIQSETKTAHCVLMTLEGLVLFEAEYHDTIDIQRALPPFDKPGFAEGLIEDLMLIFFKPDMPLTHTGYTQDGAAVCRHQSKGKGAQDIIVPEDKPWRIVRYNKKKKIIRDVSPDMDAELTEHGFPERVTLKAPGILGYQLMLSLLSAEPMQTSNNNK